MDHNEEDEKVEDPLEANPNVIYLPDAQLESTETDSAERKETRHVSFVLDEIPSTSRQSAALERQKLDEAKSLAKDMIEVILPASESDAAEEQSVIVTEQPIDRSEEQRLHRILHLINNFSRNLENIEMQALRRVANQEANQQCELGTQTSLVMATPSSRRKLRQNTATLKSLRNQPDVRPPCERTHHTITINSNNSTRRTAPTPYRRRTLCSRIGQTLSDFAAAVCLCMQVNKDCIFCLGFFVAFVVSASFLTAFFYRTMSLSTSVVRVPMDAAAPLGSPSYRGYYYVYNNPKERYV